MADFDFVLVGAGLQNGLLALSLLHHRPGVRIALVERESRAGGNHTWSFHAGDVPESAAAWLEPLVSRRWPAYRVRFPGFQRELQQAYASIFSVRFEQVIREKLDRAPGCRLITGKVVSRSGRREVVLEDGRALHGSTLIDARGPEETDFAGGCGYQKFVGQEVVLESGRAPELPLVMDARVEQDDGYRFVYLLPLDENRLLVEDTYFSDTPDLERPKLLQRISNYLDQCGLSVASVQREEEGVLPMPWTAPADPPGAGPLLAGYAGGYFHPATGYSLPVAVRLAEQVAVHGPDLGTFRRDHLSQAGFARLLNRMLFGLIPPGQRWRIFRRFYRLPETTIRRFYALQTTTLDRARILIDHPPGLPFLRLPGARPDP